MSQAGATGGNRSQIGELDLASQYVLVEVVRQLEKQQWMLRASFPAA